MRMTKNQFFRLWRPLVQTARFPNPFKCTYATICAKTFAQHLIFIIHDIFEIASAFYFSLKKG